MSHTYSLKISLKGGIANTICAGVVVTEMASKCSKFNRHDLSDDFSSSRKFFQLDSETNLPARYPYFMSGVGAATKMSVSANALPV